MKKTKRTLVLILSVALLLCTGIVSLAENDTPEGTDTVCLLTLVQPEHGTLKTEETYSITETGQLRIPPGTEVQVMAETADGYETDQLLLNSEPLEPDENGIAAFRMPAQDSTLELTVTEKSLSPAGDAKPDTANKGNTDDSQNPANAIAAGSLSQIGQKIPKAGLPAKAALRSAGETITSAYIKKGSEVSGGIDVIQWTDDNWSALDQWSEGILGTTSGEWLFCADPTQHFKEGLVMTSHNALEYYDQDTIDTVCALLYYVDSYGCSGLSEDQKYMIKQAFLWTALNHVTRWYSGEGYIEINYGNGLTCGCGYGIAGHYRNLYDDGIKWLETNRDNFDASGEIFTNGENQPLSRWNYEFHPTGYLVLKKISAIPELTDGNSCYSLGEAEYGIYTDEDCEDKVGTLTTDGSGNSGKIELDTGEYYIKETKAPTGYALDTNVYTAEVEGNSTTTTEVQDTPLSIPVQLLLEKTDRDTGTGVPQGNAALSGAEFTVRYYDGTYDSDPSAEGKKPLRTWVMKTGADGTVRFDTASRVSGDIFYYSGGKAALPLGTITIQETKAPAGYLPSSELFVIQITAQGNGVSAYNQPTVPESVIRGGVRIEKWDNELGRNSAQGGASLSGTRFEIISLNPNPVVVEGRTYENGDVVKTIMTDGTGAASTADDLLPYGNYRITETVPPSGYSSKGTLQRDFSVRENGALVDLNTETTAIRNNVIRGGIRIEKWDSELDKKASQGGASLEGAQFNIISLNSNPVVVERKTYQNGDTVKTIKTDSSGTVSTDPDLLPYGKYRVEEIAPPEGYNHTGILSREFTIREDSVTVNLTTSDTAIKNDVIRGDLELIKFAEPSDEEEDQMPPLKGIIFELTSKTTGETFQITTDENGYASTAQLALSSRGNLVYDTYTVHEKNTPKDLKPVDDFDVTISEEGQTLYYILEDKKILSPIQLVKTDITTGRTIPLAGAEFQLLDENKSPLTMTTWYPDKIVHDSFQTDENGSFILPEKLSAGVYYFREINAPNGYLRGEDLKFEITEGRDWAEPMTVKYEDVPAMGRIRIMKTDRETGDALADVEFTVTAAEDIVTGDGTVRAAKGEVVDTVTTDEKGNAQSCDLYLGKYTVTETRQPSGYVLPGEGVDVELQYAGQDTPLITEVLKIENIPTTLILEKVSSDTGEPLEGVAFTIWRDSEESSDAAAEGESSDSSKANGAAGEDEAIDSPVGTSEPDSGNAENVSGETFTTDENGQIILQRIEPGVWCIQETEGIPGYSFDREIRRVEVTEDGRIGGEPSLTITVENEKTKIPQTSAVIADTGKKAGIARAETTIRDTVSMSGLQVGEEYLLYAQVMDTDTGEPLTDKDGEPVNAEKTFTAETSAMEIEIDIPLDASSLAGRTVTVFDTLYIGETEAASHRDISAESQQITFPEHRIGTTALGEDTGTHDIAAAKDAVIVDTVSWEGLIPGLEYELQGVVIDKETGEPYPENEEEIRVSAAFTPQETEGTTEMRFQLDTSGLEGKDFVIFEYLYQDGTLTASHEDVNDKDQTVHVLASDEIKKETPKTGDGTDPSILSRLAGLTGLAAASAAGAWMILHRSRRHRKTKRRRHS
ncbi:MAG TPA: VaFE repeat-containing surface-anchored protein [Candidatus Mediterraneibacter norfolkensis]|nr:VaFE repeat-containing surface-anchored protein [Candidatus Mediterraneibacter norfolkensis]